MKMELATRSRRRAPPTIIFWARLINLEFAAAFILSIETLDCHIPFRNIAHRNEPKAARLGRFRDQKNVVNLGHYPRPRRQGHERWPNRRAVAYGACPWQGRPARQEPPPGRMRSGQPDP